MKNDPYFRLTPLLLGKQFIKAAKTKIDVHDGTLIMEFDGEVIHFNIFEVIRYLSDLHPCFLVDILDYLV
jgi:hypothetical protein